MSDFQSKFGKIDWVTLMLLTSCLRLEMKSFNGKLLCSSYLILERRFSQFLITLRLAYDLKYKTKLLKFGSRLDEYFGNFFTFYVLLTT